MWIGIQKHLLKNIHRRKPIHSHTQPQGSSGDNERAVFEEEIERLTQEKSVLQTKIWRYKQQKSGVSLQLEDTEKRVQEMEQKQLRMMAFVEKAAKNPSFVEHLIRTTESHLDLSAVNKKRRLPRVNNAPEIVLVDDNSCNYRADAGRVFNQDFSNRLRLELSPAVSDCNMVSMSGQGSCEDVGSSLKKTSDEDTNHANMRTQGLSFESEMIEPLDVGGMSFTLRRVDSLSRALRVNDLPSTEDGDSCHLNLTLASSSLQLNNDKSGRFPQFGQEVVTSSELRSGESVKETTELRVSVQNRKPANNHGSGAVQGRVNDVFWEQFLTERPGSSDTEEASSSFRENPYDEQEERNIGDGRSLRNKKDSEQLTL
ncbi:heat stress transcription factor A-5-like [Papaver somniferum]|uniref:heat stress transcription factor A-5-like n=1 Tax=Papaver somniferum TaxID=3469 RepID=UPI000E6FBAB6|nr:heat stress transcription factor A-5-like [Papaver somniferum]